MVMKTCRDRGESGSVHGIRFAVVTARVDGDVPEKMGLVLYIGGG